ncbi:MAG: methyltransferase [Myxococcota bacterium]|nr:methyltransferase [Myxococcota bacterium]
MQTPSDDESLDILSNRLKILQRKKGHRATSDDVLLAWAALEFGGSSKRMLDLGTGKATVAMLTLSCRSQLSAVGVEVFPQSVDLARRNTRLNGLDARLSIIEADLRHHHRFAKLGPFDLVTGAPPFMPIGTGLLPHDEQRASGRFELKGGVEDYYIAAAKNITPRGSIIVLMDGAGGARNEAAAEASGLWVHNRLDVAPRPTRPATYSITVARAYPGVRNHTQHTMRDNSGSAWSTWYQTVRRDLDLPI